MAIKRMPWLKPAGLKPYFLTTMCLLVGGLCVTEVFADVPSSHPIFTGTPAVHTVTYYDHVEVTVPKTIHKVASAWEAQNSILVMLGAGDKIVATTRVAKSIPAFRRFVPSIAQAALATMGHANDINVEALVALHPDILFSPYGLSPAKQHQLEQAGIAVASFHSNSLAALVERVGITGELLGPQAAIKAKQYQEYFRANEQLVKARLSTIPFKQRLKVYVASGMPLLTSGRPSLNQDWIDLGGGINVAEHWHLGPAHYGKANVNIEKIMAADPDVIIAMTAKDAQTILTSPQWHSVRAVKQHHVVVNPRGLFFWCRETSEEALQFVWLAKTLYPDLFSDLDMAHITQDFYQRFYAVTLTAAEVDDFLHPTH